jgi:hypothetical protein
MAGTVTAVPVLCMCFMRVLSYVISLTFGEELHAAELERSTSDSCLGWPLRSRHFGWLLLLARRPEAQAEVLSLTQLHHGHYIYKLYPVRSVDASLFNPAT